MKITTNQKIFDNKNIGSQHKNKEINHLTSNSNFNKDDNKNLNNNNFNNNIIDNINKNNSNNKEDKLKIKDGDYDITKDLLNTPSNITFAQLLDCSPRVSLIINLKLDKLEKKDIIGALWELEINSLLVNDPDHSYISKRRGGVKFFTQINN
ncbi:hypothetical protein BCR32DRAFT_248984 [Anaeromyces robustus]|uniref:Uncharacterized protein n=1 Tax=Anaeromyces robustus TaxID=1754192 RepID=A0A1Y1WRX2_9FUNG|nr:hypothetical protein BCR32DRAFT_248984 [Anaeromyces robustus]|eukprot:ORX76135.1 hypothetical protein BCR32DRAFT_248984 [Anaeromyces robustus]